MKKLNMIALILSFCSCTASAQLEFKTGPLHFFFTSNYVPNLFIEYRLHKRIGLEIGGGLINHERIVIDWSGDESEENRKKGIRGLVAAKYYFFSVEEETLNLYVGLYAQPRRTYYISDEVIKTSAVGLGIMGGFKFVGEEGFVLEFGGGVHNNTYIKTKYPDPDLPIGLTARILLGYQF